MRDDYDLCNIFCLCNCARRLIYIMCRNKRRPYEFKSVFSPSLSGTSFYNEDQNEP